MAAEEPSTGVLRGVQLEPAPESPFATAAARSGGGSPLQPGCPANSLSSSRAASAEPPALQLPPEDEHADGVGPLPAAADGDAVAPKKKVRAPQNRTVSWNVALSTVREYEISDTHSENEWASGKCCCALQ